MESCNVWVKNDSPPSIRPESSISILGAFASLRLSPKGHHAAYPSQMFVGVDS